MNLNKVYLCIFQIIGIRYGKAPIGNLRFKVITQI